MDNKDIDISISEKRVLDFMECNGKNGEALHENDCADICTDIAGVEIGLMSRENPLNIDVEEELAKLHRRHRNHRAMRILLPSISIAAAIAAVVFLAIKPSFVEKRSGLQNYLQVFQSCKSDSTVMLQVSGQTEATPIAMAYKDLEIAYNASGHEIRYDSKSDRNPTCSRINHRLSVPRGKLFKVVLSDNTEVYLNADSHMDYPVAFGAKERVVTLVGEAMFKVAKDPSRPFIVKSGNVDVLALGTEFDVRNYPSEPLKVTLVSGKVEVSHSDKKQVRELNPGQQAMVGKSMSVSDVDAEGAVFWKDGLFFFDGTTLKDMMTEIGRWYNVDVFIENERTANLRLHFYADRTQGISHLIELLNSTERIHAVYSNGQLVIK